MTMTTEERLVDERLAHTRTRIPHRVLKVYTGSSNPDLAHEIASLLG
ncbi:MAG: hypothetical protein FJZ00_13655, partial [Candidatus Sericytochromatia bacterium]|nr:hypothetical protein [Candidatus Tanganyikabacteria bacterium]